MEKFAEENFIIGMLIGAIAIFVSGMLILMYCICSHIQREHFSNLIDFKFFEESEHSSKEEIPEMIWESQICEPKLGWSLTQNHLARSLAVVHHMCCNNKPYSLGAVFSISFFVIFLNEESEISQNIWFGVSRVHFKPHTEPRLREAKGVS